MLIQNYTIISNKFFQNGGIRLYILLFWTLCAGYLISIACCCCIINIIVIISICVIFFFWFPSPTEKVINKRENTNQNGKRYIRNLAGWTLPPSSWAVRYVLNQICHPPSYISVSRRSGITFAVRLYAFLCMVVSHEWFVFGFFVRDYECSVCRLCVLILVCSVM